MQSLSESPLPLPWDAECMDVSYPLHSGEHSEIVNSDSQPLICYSWVCRQHRQLLVPTAFFICMIKKCEDSLWRFDHDKKLINRNGHKYNHCVTSTKSHKVNNLTHYPFSAKRWLGWSGQIHMLSSTTSTRFPALLKSAKGQTESIVYFSQNHRCLYRK